MTTPDTATIARELRQIARSIRGEAQLNEPGWPLRLEHLGEQLAVIAERLRGRTLVTLPAPDETDRWFRDAGVVEATIDAAVSTAKPTVYLIDAAEEMAPDEARGLGLALIAAADRATAQQPTTKGGHGMTAMNQSPIPPSLETPLRDHIRIAFNDPSRYAERGPEPTGHWAARAAVLAIRELLAERGLAITAAQERPALPPERHSPGPTGVHEGSDATEPANDAHRAAETYDLEVLGEALRATGIKVEDVNPQHLREALIETSGPPWGQGRGGYLAGLLGKQFAEDKRREASS